MRSSAWLVGIAIVAIVAAIGIFVPAASTEQPAEPAEPAAVARSGRFPTAERGRDAPRRPPTRNPDDPASIRAHDAIGDLELRGEPLRAGPAHRFAEEGLLERGVDLMREGVYVPERGPDAAPPERPPRAAPAASPARPTPAEQHQVAVDAWRARTRAAASEAATAVDPAHEEAIVGIVEAYVDDITEARSALFAGELASDEYGRIVKDATVAARRSIEHTVGSREDAEAVWKTVREANAPR